jgi:hypothetical protein
MNAQDIQAQDELIGDFGDKHPCPQRASLQGQHPESLLQRQEGSPLML